MTDKALPADKTPSEGKTKVPVELAYNSDGMQKGENKPNETPLDKARQTTSDAKEMKGLQTSEAARRASSASCLPECDIAGWLKKNDNFNKVDTDKDGFLSQKELKDAGKSKQFNHRDKLTIGYMSALHGRITNLSIDEPQFSEYPMDWQGISMRDAEVFKPFQPDLKTAPWRDPFDKNQFNIWSDIIGDKIGLRENNSVKEINAFRHGFTSAVYTLKYGETIATGLGDFNEFATGVRDWFKEKTNDWKYDSQADAYNNKVGVEIARELRQEAKQNNKPIAIEDVVQRVHQKIKDGKLITDPFKGTNSRGEILQKPQL